MWAHGGGGVSRGAPCQPRREGGLSRERPQAAAPQLSQASLPEASCATREGGGAGAACKGQAEHRILFRRLLCQQEGSPQGTLLLPASASDLKWKRGRWADEEMEATRSGENSGWRAT